MDKKLAAEKNLTRSEKRLATLFACKEPKLGPSDFLKEVKRLKVEGKMPTLEELLKVIGEVRKEYRPKILAARKKNSRVQATPAARGDK